MSYRMHLLNYFAPLGIFVRQGCSTQRQQNHWQSVNLLCASLCLCALGRGGRTKKRMNALLHKITSTCVFIRDCIQGSEKHGYYWYFSRTGWKILEHSTHHFDNGLIIWGWSMRNVGLTKVSSRNSPTSWSKISTQARQIKFMSTIFWAI